MQEILEKNLINYWQEVKNVSFHSAMKVLCYILNSDNQECLNRTYMSKALGMSYKHTGRCVAALESNGFIERRKNLKTTLVGGVFKSIDFEVIEEKIKTIPREYKILPKLFHILKKLYQNTKRKISSWKKIFNKMNISLFKIWEEFKLDFQSIDNKIVYMNPISMDYSLSLEKNTWSDNNLNGKVFSFIKNFFK